MQSNGMIVTPLGRVVPGLAGAYSGDTGYRRYDIVRYARDAFIARADVQGTPPTDEAAWMRLTEVERGAAAYVWIRYADAQPTRDEDMKETPADWIGIYSGPAEAAPTSYTAYKWQLIVVGGAGAGDMRKAIYDMDDNGQVDKADDADKLGGVEAARYLQVDGDASEATVAFEEAADRSGIVPGDSFAVAFGKLRKWFASFGTAAWKNVGAGEEDVAAGRHAEQHAAGGEDPLALEALYAYPGKLPWSPDDYKAFRNVYVYTTGDDGNDGLSAATPMRTLEAAFRKYLSTYPLMIRLGPGTHDIGSISVYAAPFLQITGSSITNTIVEGAIGVTGGSLQINSVTLRNNAAGMLVGSLSNLFLNNVKLDGIDKTRTAISASTCLVRLNTCSFVNNNVCINTSFGAMASATNVAIDGTNNQGLYASGGVIMWGTNTATHYNNAVTPLGFSRGGAISVGNQWRTQ